MTKRNWIYVALLAFIAIGIAIDAVVWPAGAPAHFTANDLVQMIGIVMLASWWQIADAEDRGVPRSATSKVLTILFVPLGSAVYLYQSRARKPATAAFVAFWAGIILVNVATAYLADWLTLD